jgi:Uma2 family endonuclease
MSTLLKQSYTIEEYVEFDKHSEERYEFFEGRIQRIGEVRAVNGSSISRTQIIVNLTCGLGNKLEGTDCEVLLVGMRVKVPASPPYRYPDLLVYCGQAEIEEIQGQQMLLNPLVLVEVLSPATEAYDLGRKFTAYQSIPSFHEYLLIAPDRPHVIQHVRQEGDKWLRSEHHGLDATLDLETLSITLPLSEIYQRVVFQTVSDIA